MTALRARGTPPARVAPTSSSERARAHRAPEAHPGALHPRRAHADPVDSSCFGAQRDARGLPLLRSPATAVNPRVCFRARPLDQPERRAVGALCVMVRVAKCCGLGGHMCSVRIGTARRAWCRIFLRSRFDITESAAIVACTGARSISVVRSVRVSVDLGD
jgi:hypothetical protein